MGATLRAVGQAVVYNADTGTVQIPAAAQEGDLLVLFQGTSGGTDFEAPTGWTRMDTVGEQYLDAFWKFCAAGDPGSDLTVDGLGDVQDDIAVVAAYSSVIAPPVMGSRVDRVSREASPNTVTTGAVSVTRGDTLVVQWGVSRRVTTGEENFTAYPATARVVANNLSTRLAVALCDQTQANPGDSAAHDFTAEGSEVAVLTFALTGNVAPNAPILTSPVDGSSINRNNTNRFTLTPSDPDGAGDSTSQTDWRYRLNGAASWTTVSKISPNTFYDFPAGTFAAGLYEWQARTYDSQGLVGPWSTSSFFTAADAPDQPAFIDPINGQSIGLASYTGVISAPDVDESEWTLYADNAGVIDTATVVAGPVLKTTGNLREHTFADLVDDTVVWWSVRTKFAGLWSQAAQIRTPVSYTPPPVPSVTLTPIPGSGALVVDVSNPTSAAGVPATSYSDVYVTDPGGSEERRKTFLPPNGSWTYWTPAAGTDYAQRVRVVAVGDNGTTSSSVVPVENFGGGTVDQTYDVEIGGGTP